VKVDWEDDWPIFNGGKSINLTTSGHSEKLKVVPSFVWSSDFSKPELERGWYQKRMLLQYVEIIGTDD
jgi:hypothetical protein